MKSLPIAARMLRALVVSLTCLVAGAGMVLPQEESTAERKSPSAAADEKAAQLRGISEDGRRLAALVGEEQILLDELDHAVNQYVMSVQLGPDSAADVSAIQRKVLDRLVITMLASQRAYALGLGAADAEVDERLNSIRAELGSPDDFRLFLTVQDMTEGRLRLQIQRQLSAEKLVHTEVLEKLVVSDREVASYYKAHREELVADEEVKVRHIFVRLRPDMSDEERDAAREKVDDIKKRLTDGGDFAELALSFSEDPSAASGGDLGWIVRGEVTGPFEVVAFSLPVDRISEVVATDYGYHILQVLEREEKGILELELARPYIVQKLREDKERTAVQDYLAELRSSGTVETFLPGAEAGS